MRSSELRIIVFILFNLNPQSIFFRLIFHLVNLPFNVFTAIRTPSFEMRQHVRGHRINHVLHGRTEIVHFIKRSWSHPC